MGTAQNTLTNQENLDWTSFWEAWDTSVQFADGWRLATLNRTGTEVQIMGQDETEWIEWWEATGTKPGQDDIIGVGTFPVTALRDLQQKINELTVH